MKDDRDKIEKATIILGFFLAFTEAIAMSAVFGKQGLLIKYTWYWVLIVALIWTAGASIASVLGKYITDNYIGNGISLILAMNIFSSYLVSPATLLSSPPAHPPYPRYVQST